VGKIAPLGKRQEILIEAMPGIRRIAALAHSKETGSLQLQALQDAGRARDVEVSIYRVANAEEITAAIDAAKASGAAALNVLSSPFLYGNRQLISERVAAEDSGARLAKIFPRPSAVLDHDHHSIAAAPVASAGGRCSVSPDVRPCLRLPCPGSDTTARRLALFRGLHSPGLEIEPKSLRGFPCASQ
jgi:hypothetical protein